MACVLILQALARCVWSEQNRHHADGEDKAGEPAYLRVVILEFRNESAEGARPGHRILQPILEQCDRVRQARKGRRPVQDVDPDTGEELAEQAAA